MTQKYRYVSSMTYELPFGKGKKWMNHGRILDAVLGGYSFRWNFSVWAPTPVSLGYSGGTYVDPVTRHAGSPAELSELRSRTVNDLYLIQIPQLRDNWQDIGPNRFDQTTQNPLVTNCGTAPIMIAANRQPPSATIAKQ